MKTDNSNAKLFFVRGYMKSGTTWVKSILDFHPRIVCRGEYHLEIIKEAFR